MRGAGFRERVDSFVNSSVTILFRLLFVRFLPCFFSFLFFFLLLLAGWLLYEFPTCLAPRGRMVYSRVPVRALEQSWIELNAL